MNKVVVIGGGLAGCEASYQLLKRGINVDMYEMKPYKMSPAHHNENLCELVCSNSFKSTDITTASGLLKAELQKLDSLVLDCAYKCQVGAGSALAVDREQFSNMVTTRLKEFKNFNLINQEIKEIPSNCVVIIATGPLTSDDLSISLANLLSQSYLYFYDACAPIINYDTIDMNKAFFGDRYGKGNNDYINLPLTKEEYLTFYNELINAETVKLKEFEDIKVFEGCMPVEIMAKRGENTLRFGPLKPVGITNPDGTKPYAVVQLRKEDNYNKLYNMVGFQTNLTFKEQKRVFGLIPALKNAEFVRYGVMHRNTFVNAPNVLKQTMQLKNNENIFLAGQLSGVEGYLESVGSGLIAGINAYRLVNNQQLLILENNTALGSLINYTTNFVGKNFQPMHVNYGIIDSVNIKDAKTKKETIYNCSMKSIDEFRRKYGI